VGWMGGVAVVLLGAGMCCVPSVTGRVPGLCWRQLVAGVLFPLTSGRLAGTLLAARARQE
jgi:hypothetical protein